MTIMWSARLTHGTAGKSIDRIHGVAACAPVRRRSDPSDNVAREIYTALRQDLATLEPLTYGNVLGQSPAPSWVALR